MRKTKFVLALFILLFTFCIASCKKDDNPPIDNPPIIKPEPVIDEVSVGIKGTSEVKSGFEAQYRAYVDGEVSNEVTWEIKTGADYATLSNKGLLSAKEVTGDKIIEIIARSTKNDKCFGSKVITIVAKPNLTQSMLDALKVDKIGFEGYLNISVYEFGVAKKLKTTYTTVVKTAMDGTDWYAEYENGDTGTKMGLYYKNHDNYACQVGVNFMNSEQYEPMVDDDGKKVTWEDSGLYNVLQNLTVKDFKFNEDTWRYEYKSKGRDDSLTKRLIASANPYDFEQDPNHQFQLIIEENEVLGFYVKSSPDYTIVQQYESIQELFVAVGYGDTVKVPKINKYPHRDFHDDLDTAISNMRNLSSYTLDFYSITASYLTRGYVREGFKETITDTDCYFEPYSMTFDEYGKDLRVFDASNNYGYHKINDTLYNTYHIDNETNTYKASRAYNEDFQKAKPTFAFSSEIFTSYIENEDGSVTYYVDELMTPVASTFYYGVGNDINLYGIFATKGYLTQTSSFTPFITVKDGKIVSSCFYFYLGSLYGIVEIEYTDFNTAKLPDGVKIDFDERKVPTSWNELTIIKSSESGKTEDDEEVNALDFLKSFFKEKSNIDETKLEETMPFFGKVLGDTYGFGMTSVHIPTGKSTAYSCITFYYDVPLGTDYTIKAPLADLEEYLLSLGFTKNKAGEFSKDGIYVAPVDSSLDLIIYVWGEKF